MANIIDRHVVMLAPKKWHGIESLPLSQHIAGGGLTLAFGHNPMLDPDFLS
jgi:hypothetical protein